MTGLESHETGVLVRFAHSLADAAAAVTMPWFRGGFTTEHKEGKGAFDPVTQADRGAEAAMRSLIEARYPDHGILGEEFGTKSGSSGWTWVLDPIDGTRSFIIGAPVWGTLIALAHDGEPVIGIFDQPFTGERFVGAPGLSEHHHGGKITPLRVSGGGDLPMATLCTTSMDAFADPADAEAFTRLWRSVRLTRFGMDCYAYGLCAMGGVDLVVEADLAPYDIQALVPIIRNAGGLVTTWDNGSPAKGGRILAAGSERLHAAAMEILLA